ncbi:MAG TPA: trypsin-like peptidase domain-containing protein [Anaerolineales bacterium]|nr:trypsin-like peptidase domain-containing protein [Anaerolineales bacterium]
MSEPSQTILERVNKWRKDIASLSRRSLPFISGVFATLVAILIYHFVFVQPNQLTIQDVNASVVSVMASATPPPAYSAQVYQLIQPSLVLIQTEETHQNAESGHGLGSGVIVDAFGDILTSRHVIEGASQITVTFADGSESEAQVVTEMPELDLAVLQALDTPLTVAPAVLGNPGAMRVGDEAYVVGHPFGLYGSMSSGVISGFDRVFSVPDSNIQIPGMIQFDAAANPGNSGGPLLNRYGQVIGIVTGLINPTEENFFVGIGFAVPINTAVGGMGGSPPY